MGYRQVYIKSADKLSLMQENIRVLRSNGEELLLPISDISYILIEDPNTILTTCLITKLSESGVSLVLCDSSYLPAAQVLPINTYFNQSRILKLQVTSSKELDDEIWKKIIYQKITNQALCIEFTTTNQPLINTFHQYASSVTPGDAENREGTTSKMFFRELYGSEFVRFGSSSISSALNYGYSILHSSIVRHLASYGLNTCIGVWHDSDQNAFNLASDFIEPFRPVVDLYVYWNLDKIQTPLSKEVRKDLINILNADIIIDNKVTKVENAINVVVLSYIKCLENNSTKYLLLPQLMDNIE